MKYSQIGTVWINGSLDPRLVKAQEHFLSGVYHHRLQPLLYTTTPGTRPWFGKVLEFIRNNNQDGEWIIWCNSDCFLHHSKLGIPDHFLEKSLLLDIINSDKNICHGFHRQEWDLTHTHPTKDNKPSYQPTNRFCDGVDLYAIPIKLWDDYLSKDIPQLYIGATHIDWWITRACEKINVYKGHKIPFFLNHLSHDQVHGPNTQSEVSLTNIKNFNEWADRNKVKKD